MHTSVYSKAVSLGYPFRWGEGRPTADCRVWLTRFQKSDNPDDPEAIYVGWDTVSAQYVVEYE